MMMCISTMTISMMMTKCDIEYPTVWNCLNVSLDLAHCIGQIFSRNLQVIYQFLLFYSLVQFWHSIFISFPSLSRLFCVYSAFVRFNFFIFLPSVLGATQATWHRDGLNFEWVEYRGKVTLFGFVTGQFFL